MAVSYANKLAGSLAAAVNGSGRGAAQAKQPRVAPAAGTPAQLAANGSKDVGAKSPASPGAESSSNERLLFGASVLIGYRVEVQVKSGAVYEGIFHTMNISDSDVHVVLKFAKLIRDPNVKPGAEKDALAERPQTNMTVLSSDLVQVVAKDVRFNAEDLAADDRNDGFDTDAAIGRGRAGATWGRELQRWAPDETDDGMALTLDSGDGKDGGQWDQFAVNREKFGVESTFDEHIYTTRIDRDNCAISEAEAERLAREIEGGFGGSITANVHQMEERGMVADDSGDMDEEDKYSAVVRPGAAQGHQQPQQQHHHGGSGGGYQPHSGGYQGGSGGGGYQGSSYDRRPRFGSHPQQQHGHHSAPPAPPAPRAPAWGGMGSGVVAVAGRMPSQGGLPPPPPPPPQRAAGGTPVSSDGGASGTAAVPLAVPGARSSPVDIVPPPSQPTTGGTSASSTPIDIDPLRREANKVRSQLLAETGVVAAKRDRSSPYGTPKGLKDSPLVHDPDSMRALHLIPGKTSVHPEVDKEFKAWKQQQQQGQDKRPQGVIDDLKKFGSSFNAPGLRAPGQAADAAPAAAGPAASSSIAAAAAPAAAAAAAAAPGAATAASDSSGADKASDAVPLALAKESSAVSDSAPKKTSSLNPNAKPFALNFNAKPFVPPGAPAAAAPAVATATPAGPLDSAAGGGGSSAASGLSIAAAAAGPASEAASAGAGASAPSSSAGPAPSGHSGGAPSHPHHAFMAQQQLAQGGSGLGLQAHHGAAPHHGRSGSGGSGMHLRGDREQRSGSGSGGMDRRAQGMGGRVGMMGEGHFPGHHQGPGMQGPGMHKSMGSMGAGGHYMGSADHHSGGPEHMGGHKGGPPHMGLNPDHMGGHKGSHMGSSEHMGHKGAPPPPHHGPGAPMEAPAAMMVHGMAPHMAGPMGMPHTAYMQMAPGPFHIGPGGTMVPAGGMMPANMYPGMRPGMSPNGAPVMVQYSYPMAMAAGAPGPGGRPPFFPGMPMGMPMQMMAAPMPSMEHAPRGMGGPSGGGSTTPTGGAKGMRGGPRPDRREGGGFHGEGRHHHSAPVPHHGGGPSEGDQQIQD